MATINSTSKDLQIETTTSSFSWANEYVLSTEEANEIADPEWVIEDLIISGHLIIIPAEPNAGKTTILAHLAGEMVDKGYEVFYVNADISGGDAKPMREQALESGYTLMLPDMKAGLSMNTVLSKLTDMSELPERFDKTIFVFDTLKKIIDLLIKSQAKNLFELLRKLTAKGMTIVLLAHTNKYTNKDGSPIYEGTGDIRSDVDELIYLIPHKNNDGSITVTTAPNKVRGTFNPITFHIDKDRNVTKADDVINTIESNRLTEEVNKDEAGINAITSAISADSTSQKNIIEYCSGFGSRIITNLLKKYSSENTDLSPEYHLWSKSKGQGKSYVFSLIKQPSL